MLPPVVDAHIHFRDVENLPYDPVFDRSNGDESAARQPESYLPEDYFLDVGDDNVVGFVHVEAGWSKADPAGESRWLNQLDRSKRTRDLPFSIVGFADLSDSDIEKILEQHAAIPKVRGVRQMLCRVDGNPSLTWAPREYLEDPLWLENFAALAKYHLHFDAMCFAHQMPSLAKLAGRHDDIPLHLEHAGLPWDHSEDGREAWRRGLRALAALPHCDVKISGLGNTIPAWTPDKIRPYVLETIDIFGAERVAFASNFPTDRAFSSLREIWSAFNEITASFAPSERRALFSENALRMYQIRPSSPHR